MGFYSVQGLRKGWGMTTIFRASDELWLVRLEILGDMTGSSLESRKWAESATAAPGCSFPLSLFSHSWHNPRPNGWFCSAEYSISTDRGKLQPELHQPVLPITSIRLGQGYPWPILKSLIVQPVRGCVNWPWTITHCPLVSCQITCPVILYTYIVCSVHT